MTYMSEGTTLSEEQARKFLMLAVKAAGGVPVVAREIGVSRAAVHNAISGESKIYGRIARWAGIRAVRVVHYHYVKG